MPTFRWGALVLALLVLALPLVSCSDDSDCASPYYSRVTATLDSARYLVRTKDSLVQGAVAGSDEKRVQNQLSVVSSGMWDSKPRVRSYVADLAGILSVGGRLGLLDTLVYYEVDSVDVLPGDGRSAAIRMEFRSTLGTFDPYSYSYAASRTTDTSVVYWNLRGRVECTLPIEASLASEKEFSCALDASGERNASFHLEFKVVKYRYEYECSSSSVSG